MEERFSRGSVVVFIKHMVLQSIFKATFMYTNTFLVVSPVLEVSEQPTHTCTDVRVFLHPSSVLFGKSTWKSPFLAFFQKQMTTGCDSGVQFFLT
jgi:hypothetical protein